MYYTNAWLGPIQYFTQRIIAHAVVPDSHNWFSIYGDSPLHVVEYPTELSWPLPQSLEIVNGGVQCRMNSHDEPLKEDLEKFVSDPRSRGTILISFGSIIPWDKVPDRIIDSLADVAARLPDYRVVWSYNKGPKRDFPPNVMTMDWLPQVDLLAHRNTVLFVTHGGLKRFDVRSHFDFIRWIIRPPVLNLDRPLG